MSTATTAEVRGRENTRSRFTVSVPSSAAVVVFVSPVHAGRTATNTHDFASGLTVAGDDPVNETDPSGDNAIVNGGVDAILCELDPEECLAEGPPLPLPIPFPSWPWSSSVPPSNSTLNPGDQWVVRGGLNDEQRWINGSQNKQLVFGNLVDVSVNSAPGATIQELSADLPNKQISVSTRSAVTGAGGQVLPKPLPGRPLHASLNGITPATAVSIFTQMGNPNQPVSLLSYTSTTNCTNTQLTTT